MRLPVGGFIFALFCLWGVSLRANFSEASVSLCGKALRSFQEIRVVCGAAFNGGCGGCSDLGK